jgi:hypothetical protein
MRKFLLVLAIITLSSSAAAEGIKIQSDIGVPDGAGIGLGIPFAASFLQLNGAITYGVAPGFRGGLTLNPYPTSIVHPTLSTDLGYSFRGSLPFNQLPDFSYTYFNLQPGLEFGLGKWRSFIRGGFSWVSLETYDFGNSFGNRNKGFLIQDPVFEIKSFTSFKIGLSYQF